MHAGGDRDHAYQLGKLAEAPPPMMLRQQAASDTYRSEGKPGPPFYYRISPTPNGMQSSKSSVFPPRKQLQGPSFFDKMK